MKRSLPNRPSLASLRKQAKALHHKWQDGDDGAGRRVRDAHPMPPGIPSLRDAQLVIAREYGLEDWEHLVRHVQLATGEADVLAERFLQGACLRYAGPTSPALRRVAQALLTSHPEIVPGNLFVASAVGDVEEARRILAADPSRATKPGGPRGWVPLMYLCYSRVLVGDALGVARLLLSCGADPDSYAIIPDNLRFTAIAGAMGDGEHGPVEFPPHPQADALVHLLLDAGASPNQSQGLYNTCFGPSNKWIELFTSRGLSPQARANWDDEDPPRILDFLLGVAVRQGFVERVRLLLSLGVSPDGRNHYNKRTHLENAILDGKREIADLLRQYGAKVVALSEDSDRFKAAIVRGDRAEAERLLQCHPEWKADGGRLPAVAETGHADAVAMMLDLGFAIDGTGPDGMTALHNAARGGHLAVARLLIARGADTEIHDRTYSGTPADHAHHLLNARPRDESQTVLAFLLDHCRKPNLLVLHGRIEQLARLLDEDPARANALSAGGNRPLHVLPSDRDTAARLVDLLLRHGADLEGHDSQGRTPLEAAQARGSEEAVAALRARGARG